jgi:hypothetical protein
MMAGMLGLKDTEMLNNPTFWKNDQQPGSSNTNETPPSAPQA